MTDYAKARTNMVDSQLRPNRVNDPATVAAFLAVPREQFVPQSLKGAAYADEDLPLGRQRWLMEPMVLARLVEEAGIAPSDAVLEVGAGTGYGAAILAELARTVVAVEPDSALASEARANLAGRPNIAVVERPIAAGCPENGPYDVILLAGAVPEIPEALLGQLAEGGRLVGVVRAREHAPGEAVILRKIAGAWARRVLFEAGTRPLPGLAAAPAFNF